MLERMPERSRTPLPSTLLFLPLSKHCCVTGGSTRTGDLRAEFFARLPILLRGGVDSHRRDTIMGGGRRPATRRGQFDLGYSWPGWKDMLRLVLMEALRRSRID